MRMILATFLLIGALGGAAAPACAVAAPEPVTPAVQHQVIAAFVKLLNEHYVFPDRAATASKALIATEQAGAFRTITDPDAFAKAVTKTLSGILHDKHLSVDYSPDPLPPTADANRAPSRKSYTMFQKDAARWNFGITKAIRLRGNVGYLDLLEFPPAAMMGDTLAAAMAFLSNTDYLIVDLRENGGGDPGAVALVSSYFFQPWQKVHLNDIYSRTPGTNTGETRQYWATYVPGPRFVDKPVYVLTSSNTFSGGEEFAYDMQTQKRATLVGEITGGGANPGRDFRLSDHFETFIPGGRAVNPVTNTNWEGVGVKPDIATNADAALPTAYFKILREEINKTTDPDERKHLTDLLNESIKNPTVILQQ